VIQDFQTGPPTFPTNPSLIPRPHPLVMKYARLIDGPFDKLRVTGERQAGEAEKWDPFYL